MSTPRTVPPMGWFWSNERNCWQWWDGQKWCDDYSFNREFNTQVVPSPDPDNEEG